MKTLFTIRIAWFAATLVASLTNCLGTPLFNPDTGNYYEAVRSGTPWSYARDAAAASSYLGLSGHLVTITSQSENDFVYNNVYPTAFTASSSGTRIDWVWLGAFQLPGSVEPSAGWSWVTGEAFSYSNWDPGQPSDSSAYGVPQDLLIMWSGGTWNDITGPDFGSGGVSGYIIEYEAVPEPGILSLLAASACALWFRQRSKRTTA